jgi:hypothetical protein
MTPPRYDLPITTLKAGLFHIRARLTKNRAGRVLNKMLHSI